MVCKRRAAEEGAVSLCKAKFRTCLCPAQQHQHDQAAISLLAGSNFLACALGCNDTTVTLGSVVILRKDVASLAGALSVWDGRGHSLCRLDQN